MEIDKKELKTLENISKKYHEITLDIEQEDHRLAVDRDVKRLKHENKRLDDVIEILVAGSGTGKGKG